MNKYIYGGFAFILLFQLIFIGAATAQNTLYWADSLPQGVLQLHRDCNKKILSDDTRLSFLIMAYNDGTTDTIMRSASCLSIYDYKLEGDSILAVMTSGTSYYANRINYILYVIKDGKWKYIGFYSVILSMPSDSRYQQFQATGAVLKNWNEVVLTYSRGNELIYRFDTTGMMTTLVKGSPSSAEEVFEIRPFGVPK